MASSVVTRLVARYLFIAKILLREESLQGWEWRLPSRYGRLDWSEPVVIENMLQVLHQDSSVVGAKAVNVKISSSSI